MSKQRLSIKELELMCQAKYLGTSEICGIEDELLGDKEKHNMVFDIFDGFAYCHNYKGKEYYMNYPKLVLIKDAEVMQKNIRESLGLSEDEEISVQHILSVYFQLKVNE